jgi:hypothetical protein
MKWVLDDGPLGLLAQWFCDDWRWPGTTLHVVDVVASAAGNDKSGRRAKLLSLSSEGEPSIAVHEIPADSAVAEMVIEHLRPDQSSSTKDLGEDVSIAYCAVQDLEATFVTTDKGAAYLALAELGPGRVASPFDLWLWLAREGLVTTEVRDALNAATARKDGASPGVPRRFAPPEV